MNQTTFRKSILFEYTDAEALQTDGNMIRSLQGFVVL